MKDQQIPYVSILKKHNYRLSIGELKSHSSPDNKGMEIAYIYHEEELIKTICNNKDKPNFIEEMVIPALITIAKNLTKKEL